MPKHMNIEYNTYPFPHAVADGVISLDAGHRLHSFADSIEEDTISFTRNGEQQDNMAMHNNSQGKTSQCGELHMEVYGAFEQVSKLFDEYDPYNYRWSHSLTETNRKNGNFLHPHTDDPEVIRERQKTMKEGAPDPSILKAVLYVPHNRIQYPHYGTKIYLDDDRSSFIKEIQFKPCRLFMWKTQSNSWHGTDFINGLPHRRFFYTGEYLKLESERFPSGIRNG